MFPNSCTKVASRLLGFQLDLIGAFLIRGKNISKNNKKLLTKNKSDDMMDSKERLENFNGGCV